MKKINKIIEFKNATYKYKSSWCDTIHTVFQDINLIIEKGDFVALMGSNGCGKSTLSKHINGLLTPTHGDVFVDGINTKNEEKSFEIKKKVGLIFQNPDNQIVASTVEEEVAFGLENLCIAPKEMKNKIKNALSLVGLDGFEKKSIQSLSGGQKQRLVIASVLAMEPEIIVLDEPTSMLDPEGRKEVIGTIINLNKTKKITSVLITHNISEALWANRLIIMENGQISAYASPQKVFSNYEFIKSHPLASLESTEILCFLKENGYDVNLSAFDFKSCADEILRLAENAK